MSNIKVDDIFEYAGAYRRVRSLSDKPTSWPITGTALVRTEDKDTYPINVTTNFAMSLGRTFTLRYVKGKHPVVTLQVTLDNIIFNIETICRQSDVKVQIEKHLKSVKEAEAHTRELEKTGRAMAPQSVIIEETTVDSMHITGETLHDRFNSVVGSISELTKGINESTALSETGDLAELFISTQKKIRDLLGTPTTKPSTFFTKALVAMPFGEKLLAKGSATFHNNSSIQRNIDVLFGSIHEKYEKLLVVGEGLQTAKAHMLSQVTALKVVALESAEAIKAYVNKTDIPMRVISLDTQIQASVAKYQARILKLEGAITATQATITALGRDLPSMKTDLTDEMAIGTLLSSLDDYQKMWGDIAGLVSDVAETTSEKVHTSVENLLQLQIDDTHTMEYLANTAKRTEKFKTMITQKTTTLASKVAKDAATVANITASSAIEHVRQEVRKIA